MSVHHPSLATRAAWVIGAGSATALVFYIYSKNYYRPFMDNIEGVPEYVQELEEIRLRNYNQGKKEMEDLAKTTKDPNDFLRNM
mmetsp:Transcript_16301/g.18134  ORF Transcript_16301/g.18134 Transcript_16301/m.18134 type:complete len:84 (+) Transcript_16301:7-258(+)